MKDSRKSMSARRLSLLHERAHRFLVVLGARGLHQPFGFAIERGRIVDVQRVVEIVLHVAQRHSRALGQRLGQREGLLPQFVVGHDPVDQTDAFAALRVDPFGGEHQLARPALSPRRGSAARRCRSRRKARRAHSRC
jgi:hypothetical protein